MKDTTFRRAFSSTAGALDKSEFVAWQEKQNVEISELENRIFNDVLKVKRKFKEHSRERCGEARMQPRRLCGGVTEN